jgi:hypothetical protein
MQHSAPSRRLTLPPDSPDVMTFDFLISSKTRLVLRIAQLAPDVRDMQTAARVFYA